MTTIKKPPQTARTKRDQQWMEDWLKALLEEMYDQRLEAACKQIDRQTQEETNEIEEMMEDLIARRPIELAETYGIMEPVRRKFPHLAKLLKPPERGGKGKRFPKDKYYEAMTDLLLSKLSYAVWDAENIRTIWKKHYRPMPKGYGSAEEIAASLWDVKAHQVHEWKASRDLPDLKVGEGISPLGNLLSILQREIRFRAVVSRSRLMEKTATINSEKGKRQCKPT